MKVQTVPATELQAEHVAAWSTLQCAAGGVDSPFFCPEFTQAVAAVRDDVEVAILEDNHETIGFFPFQRGVNNDGRPVGGRLSDFQGIVLKSAVVLDPMWLLRGCHLTAWHFDHLVAMQPAFAPFSWTSENSPFIDVSVSYDAYLAERRAAGAADVMQALSKRKRFERQLGKIRFELHADRREVLDALIKWKTQQYQRSQVTSVFAFPWIKALLERLLATPREADFACMLSALYFGERLAAAHIGIRSRNVVHWWFPAYDPELSKYSPGAQLLLEMIKASHDLGMERIDLGKGQEPYKSSFMTGALPLAVGSVDLRPATRTVRRFWHQTKRWVRDSPLRGPASVPWQWIRQVRDQMQFR